MAKPKIVANKQPPASQAAEQISAEQAGNASERGGVTELSDLAPDGDPDEDEPSPFTPYVQDRLGRMLDAELAIAERDERDGPGGGGWMFNESKRAEVQEWAAFLRMAKGQFPRGEEVNT